MEPASIVSERLVGFISHLVVVFFPNQFVSVSPMNRVQGRYPVR